MSRPCLFLTLLLVLSGAPLRLAEAASDLARSIAGPEEEGEFEVVDGGVGDESGEAITAETGHDATAADDSGIEWSWSTWPIPHPPAFEARPPGFPPWPPAVPRRRYVLLRCLLC